MGRTATLRDLHDAGPGDAAASLNLSQRDPLSHSVGADPIRIRGDSSKRAMVAAHIGEQRDGPAEAVLAFAADFDGHLVQVNRTKFTKFLHTNR